MDKTDKELAADARMIAAELSKVRAELHRRGIECDVMTYGYDAMQVDIERVTREKL